MLLALVAGSSFARQDPATNLLRNLRKKTGVAKRPKASGHAGLLID